MPRNPSIQPTKAELKILRVLWRRGPSTVRQVYEQMGGGYTTVLKLMQIMVGKGLLARDESARTHVYRTAIPEDRARKGLVRDLMERAFGGSARDLILQVLSAKRTSRAELAEIRKLIEEMERKSHE